MTELIIDTKKIEESGNDIIILTKELNEQIDALFSRIDNMSTNTLEWIGPAANEFIRRANIEKKQYLKIVDSLKKYGKTLVSAANNYEISVNKVLDK